MSTRRRPTPADCPPDAAPPRLVGPEAEARLAALCRALGHPARVRILKLLVERDTCIAGELADEVGLAPSTVSEHLKTLKAAGLIKGEVDGPRRCYCVDRSVVTQLRKLLSAL